MAVPGPNADRKPSPSAPDDVPVKKLLSTSFVVFILQFLSIQCCEVEKQTINIVLELEFVLT